jgi:predicted alpha/beta-hydrolase family hydrolase
MHPSAALLPRSLPVLLFVSMTLGAAPDPIANSALLVDFPSGPGPFPAVVLAPGQGYHMALPAMQQTSAALVKRGFAVYRFNWSYWTREPKGDPSDDLSTELRDLQRIVATARADSRVDSKRVAVGGKSLGSLVAWQAFRDDRSLTSALLLTPVCSQQVVGKGAASAIAANYPDIETEPRPLFFVLGDRDPLCEPKALFRYAASAKGPVRLSVVSGDHGFNSARRDSTQGDATLERNVGLVAEAAADFAAQVEANDRERLGDK